MSAVKPWRLNIAATKRNVFFTLSNPEGKVKKLLTPGSLLKKGVTKEEYNSLDDKKLRRKKRSLRLYLNRQKISRPACAQTWTLMNTYIVKNKLNSQPFILTLEGPNFKLSRELGRKIIEKNQFTITQIFIKKFLPHNGCPQRILKRKKNKGRNRFRKRGLMSSRPRKLPRARNYKKKLSYTRNALAEVTASSHIIRSRQENIIPFLSTQARVNIYKTRRQFKVKLKNLRKKR